MTGAIFIGGCVVDLICYTDEFPKIGETYVGNTFTKGFGGKAANQCTMARNLGLNTALISKLGNDNFGHEFKDEFKRLGINDDFVPYSKDAHTSTANITVDKKGQNQIVYIPGANARLTVDDVESATKLFFGAKILVGTFECNKESLLAALKIAKSHNVLTLVNAAPPPSHAWEELYSLIDILCVNETELTSASGVNCDSMENIATGIEHLLIQGCKKVIVTLGENGAVFSSKESPQPQHIASPKVIPVDTTGAGDSFLGSLCYFLTHYENLSLEEQISRACEIASISVTKPGTQTSFPMKNEIPKRLLEPSPQK